MTIMTSSVGDFLKVQGIIPFFIFQLDIIQAGSSTA